MKTVLITGGTGGIGRVAAAALAKQGHRVIIQGLNPDTGKAVLEDLKKSGNVELIIADISSLQGIKQLAAEVKKRTDKLDVFIQSTGRLNSARRETVDGLDEGFVVNYLNRFMLDNLLLEELKKGEGRIIIVGAPVMKNAKVNFDDLQQKNKYSLMAGMGQAMLMVHLHVQEFAKRYGNHPIINVIHPGVVNTGIGRNLSGIMKFFIGVMGPLIGNSADKAILNIVDLAEGKAEGAGYFYPKVGNSSIKEKLVYDEALAAKVWEESKKIAGL